MAFKRFVNEATGKSFLQTDRGVSQMIADMQRAQKRLLSGKTLKDGPLDHHDLRGRNHPAQAQFLTFGKKGVQWM